MRRECRERFPPPRVSDPDMHHGMCVTHMLWCMPRSLTSGFLWSRWRGKRSRHSRRMRNPQFFLSVVVIKCSWKYRLGNGIHFVHGGDELAYSSLHGGYIFFQSARRYFARSRGISNANSMRPADTYMHKWIRKAFVCVLACRMFGSK